MLQPLAGHDPLDPASSRAPVPTTSRRSDGPCAASRIGVPRNYFFEGIDPEVARRVRGGARDAPFARRGRPRRGDTPASGTTPSFMVILASEAFAYHERDLRERPEMYGDVLRDRLLARWALSPARSTCRRMRIRERLRREMPDALRTVDLLATPTTPKPAPHVRWRLRHLGGLPAEQHAALQPHRAAGARASVRVLARRAADLAAARRPAVRRGDGAACRARVRAGHGVAHPPAASGRVVGWRGAPHARQRPRRASVATGGWTRRGDARESGATRADAVRIRSIVLHCREFDRMVAFWRETLNYVPRESAHDGWVVPSDRRERVPSFISSAGQATHPTELAALGLYPESARVRGHSPRKSLR